MTCVFRQIDHQKLKFSFENIHVPCAHAGKVFCLIQFEHLMMSILNILLICHLLIGFRYQVKLEVSAVASLVTHQGELPR